MNYTREPIIETVITPKEGYKLIVRNSKGSGHEEYAVDAIEVVSFGNSFFFRSLERPKSFLVPASDYEVLEMKETRIVLKNASFERAIKIGGGREANVKAAKEKPAEDQEPAVVEQKLEKKRERRRHRRRRSSSGEVKEAHEAKPAEPKAAEGEAPPPSPTLSRLIPPPTQLISDRISKEKKPEAPPAVEGDVFPEAVEENDKPKGRKKKKEEELPPEAEGGEVQRIVAEAPEPITSTSFSTLEKKGKFSIFGKIW